MKINKKVLFVPLAVVVLYCCIVASLFVIMAVEDDEKYAESSGWKCEEKDFYGKYAVSYQNKIEELMSLYEIEASVISEKRNIDEDNIVEIYIYNDIFTVKIFFANRGLYADYKVNLFFYGSETTDLDDYETHRHLVQFINDLTKYVAYDTRSDERDNHFEALYLECKEKERDTSGYVYHFDHTVGNVGYYVGMKKDNFGYYYKMQKNSDIKISSNSFSFEGLLKPLGQ